MMGKRGEGAQIEVMVEASAKLKAKLPKCLAIQQAGQGRHFVL